MVSLRAGADHEKKRADFILSGSWLHQSLGAATMNLNAQQEYDRVLYPGAAYSQTHPDRLSTLASLFGMHPAPVEGCRVLEIGCTDGGNLLPMAEVLPNADFIGIDVSTRALTMGRECIEALGLPNIRLLELDLLDMPEDFGAFDFIIAHGVYSWVPPQVREKLLAVCRAHLAPHGIAYVSYNAYPGNHLRDLVRGMMRFHVGRIEDPDEKRRQAASLLNFIIEAQPEAVAGDQEARASQREAELFRQLLARELERINKATPAAFYHDDLADICTPFYFHEFIAQAARQGLQYLSEATFSDMQEQGFAPQAVTALQALGNDRITREQYLDFLKCRRFRQTLLCHHEVALSGPHPEPVRRFFISSRAKPVSVAARLEDGALEEFTAPGNASVKTQNSLPKAALLHLAEIWPRSISFDELRAVARRRLDEKGIAPNSDEEVSELAGSLLEMYAAPVVQLHVHAPRFTLEPSERPILSQVVRWFLAKGARTVTNLRHRSVRFEDPVAVQLMLLLDGTRNREAYDAYLRGIWHLNGRSSVTPIVQARVEERRLAVYELEHQRTTRAPALVERAPARGDRGGLIVGEAVGPALAIVADGPVER